MKPYSGPPATLGSTATADARLVVITMHRLCARIIFVAILFAFSPLYAKSCDDEPKGSPKLMLRVLDNIEPYVPFVPPEEVTYLDKEYAAAFKTGSLHRLGALTQRPYYYAWQLHIQFANARALIKEIDDIPEIVGIKMRIQMASRLPFQMANARSAWDDYVWNTNALTPEQIRHGAEEMTRLSGLPDFYIWCLADLIDQK